MVKIANYCLCSFRGEVNEDIAAEDDVDRSRSVQRRRKDGVRKVERKKCYHLSNLWTDYEPTVWRALKVTSLDTVRSVAEGPFGIHPAGGALQKPRVDIRSDDRDTPVGELGNGRGQRDRDRIRFLAGTTGGTPDAKMTVSELPILHKRRKNLSRQRLESTLFTKEVRFTNGEVIGEYGNLLLCERSGMQPVNTGLDIGKSQILGGCTNSAFEIMPAIRRKMPPHSRGNEIAALRKDVIWKRKTGHIPNFRRLVGRCPTRALRQETSTLRGHE